MQYYLVFKKKKILSFVTTRMNLEGIILSEISQTDKGKCCMVSLIWNLKKKKKVISKKQRVEQ